jgi:GH15 family glucan-1,4-alpha-glucosidase
MADETVSNPRLGRTIGDHGVVGNLTTAALVARDGTIDFLCWPKLDSPSIFAGLLDPAQGGEFALAPLLDDARIVQLYVPDTNVLLTRWLAEDGGAEITDLMPHPDQDDVAAGSLIRRIKVTRGRVRFRLRCRPRFDYARRMPDCAAIDGGVVFDDASGQRLRLTGSAPLGVGQGEASAEFVLDCGQDAFFVLQDDGAAPPPESAAVARCIERTLACWRGWAARSTYRGRWREEVTRSALALKLLTSRQHGSIAAAVTFGLPEAAGGARNWDYRAAWIRDASLTANALLRLGFTREAAQFLSWVGKCAHTEDGGLRVMYALDGSDAAEERELAHLAGYGGARPVRIGNAARHQVQLDIYGELLDCVYLAAKCGVAIGDEEWARIGAVVEYVRSHWRGADAGIWEPRGVAREHLHSRLLCWVALDRAISLARLCSLAAPLADWMSERDLISQDIWTNFRHPERGHFVQVRGGTELDAALLLMPLMGFVSGTDPVWLATLDAIGGELTDDGLVYRYRGEDGVAGNDGAFAACGFWYVECLARAGRLDEAQLALAKALGSANQLGLFAEELDRRAGPLGNFPQGFTHLAFIGAAIFLDAIFLDRRLADPAGGQ